MEEPAGGAVLAEPSGEVEAGLPTEPGGVGVLRGRSQAHVVHRAASPVDRGGPVGGGDGGGGGENVVVVVCGAGRQVGVVV